MLGRAAVAMWYDIPPEAREEWEDWHTHEHMPERLSIPGFLRGTRWFDANACFGLYEAAKLTTVTAGPYMERLNNPTPWSQKMMPHHHNMVRSLCRVRATAGIGLGAHMATARFSPPARRRGAVARWLSTEVIPGLPARRGFAGAHLMQAAPMKGEQTAEQKIRGGDGTADWVLLVHGYDPEAMRKLVEGELAAQLPNAILGFYRLGYALTQREVKL